VKGHVRGNFSVGDLLSAGYEDRCAGGQAAPDSAGPSEVRWAGCCSSTGKDNQYMGKSDDDDDDEKAPGDAS
jgi:hypothetical protein